MADPEDLTSTFGVLLIGFILAVVLYGLTFFQTYIYYTRFPQDSIWNKWMVGLLWAMDTSITTLISHTIYRYLITDFLVAFDGLITTRTFVAEEGLSTALVAIIHGYYAYRVWTVSEKRIVIPAVVIFLSLAAFALGASGVAFLSQQDLFSQITSHQVKLLRGLGFAMETAADFTIVGAMFFYMQPARNRGMAKAEGPYEKAVVFGFNRGSAFTLVQVVTLIVFLARPNHQGWILMHWTTTKVYINSMFAMLNFRNTHRGRGVNEEDSLNQHASNRSGSVSTPAGPRDTSRSVQFNVNPHDVKTGDPTNIIELDMVPSHTDGYDDYSGEVQEEVAAAEGSSKKIRELHDDALG